MTGTGTGYLSGNRLIAYPFADGQTIGWDVPTDSSPGEDGGDESRRSADRLLQSCFVDASLYLSSPDAPAPLIGAFGIDADGLSFKIKVGSQEVDLRAAGSGEPFPILSGNASFGRYVVVFSSEGIQELVSWCGSTGIFPSSRASSSSSSGDDGNLFLALCPRCLTRRCVGLRQIRVYDGVRSRESGPHFVLDGDISVIPGNNVSLGEPENGNGIEISAIPGAGLGAVACDCTGKEERKSPLFSPDGHTRIFNDTCYDLEPGEIGTIVVGGRRRRSRQLIVHAKCTACCTCEMYASIVNDRLASLHAAVMQAKEDIEGLSERYESSVAEFNRRVSTPTRDDVSLTMTGVPVSPRLSPRLKGTGITGSLCRCAFSAVVRNMSFQTLQAKIVSMAGTDNIVEASVSWQSDDGAQHVSHAGSADGIIDKTFSVLPGKSLVITFVSASKKMVDAVSDITYSGSISVYVSCGEMPLGFFTKSIEV